MDARGARLLVVISILFVVVLAGQFVVRLSLARDAAVQEAEAYLDGITSEILQAEEGQTGTILESNAATRAVVLYSFDTGLEYVYAQNPSYLSQLPSESQGMPRLRYDELQETLVSKTIRDVRRGVYMLQGVFAVLDRDAVYPLLRETLIYILAFLVLVIIVGIASTAPAAPPSTGVEATETTSSADRSATGVVPRDSSSVVADSHEEPDLSPSSGAEPPPSLVAPTPTEGSELPEDFEPDPEADEVGGHESEEPQEAEPVPIGHGCRSEDSQPPISPETGIGCEAYLERRVKMELDRSAHSELDLSVVLVRLRGPKRYDEEYLRAVKFLRDFFGFPDLCFELGDDGVIALLPNTDLREAIAVSERFRDSFLRNASLRPEATQSPIAIGVSSRNGRLLEPERILKEVQTAANRAEQDPGRIVGFRADARKYRQYLADSLP